MRIDRRTTIKWLAASMSVAYAGCSKTGSTVGDEIPPLLGSAATANGIGYGTDPDLINPLLPWSRTMTPAQLQASSVLCDLIIPADEHSPAASAVGVPDFVDEWISAPYRQQQGDREYILAGLEWLEGQSREQFDTGFATATEDQQTALLDLLASPSNDATDLADQIEFFKRFRFVAVGAFYATEAGSRDIGYVGNVAIAGDYPGPSDEAMAHLAGVLKRLGLASVSG